MPEEQLIKRYHSYGGPRSATRKFQKDAKKLAREGWRVVTTVPTQYNGLLVHKQGLVVVTYERVP